MSVAELEKCLQDSLSSVRSRGTKQLVGLSKDYRWLMIKALESRFEDVRHAGVEALSVIGDKESVDLLCEYLMEVRDNRNLVIATAEALSRLKAESSLSLMREILLTNEDEYIREYVARSIDRLECPGMFTPLLMAKYGRIYTNFLIEDIESVYFIENQYQEYRKSRPYYFHQDEWEYIFKLLKMGEACVIGSYALGNKLVIELKDGRKAIIYEYDGAYYYMNDSYFFHSNNELFCFKSQELTEYIEKRATNE